VLRRPGLRLGAPPFVLRPCLHPGILELVRRKLTLLTLDKKVTRMCASGPATHSDCVFKMVHYTDLPEHFNAVCPRVWDEHAPLALMRERILLKLRDEELQAIQEVARACLRVKNHDKKILAFLVSHFPVYQAGAPGDPGFIERLEIAGGEVPTIRRLQQSIRHGDLYFFLGYYRRPVEAYQAARKAGAEIVEVITGADGSDLPDPQPDYRIRPMWPYGDALVPVPGYDVKILPASGIVQSAIFWAVNATMVVENASG